MGQGGKGSWSGGQTRGLACNWAHGLNWAIGLNRAQSGICIGFVAHKRPLRPGCSPTQAERGKERAETQLDALRSEERKLREHRTSTDEMMIGQLRSLQADLTAARLEAASEAALRVQEKASGAQMLSESHTWRELLKVLSAHPPLRSNALRCSVALGWMPMRSTKRPPRRTRLTALSRDLCHRRAACTQVAKAQRADLQETVGEQREAHAQELRRLRREASLAADSQHQLRIDLAAAERENDLQRAAQLRQGDALQRERAECESERGAAVRYRLNEVELSVQANAELRAAEAAQRHIEAVNAAAARQRDQADRAAEEGALRDIEIQQMRRECAVEATQMLGLQGPRVRAGAIRSRSAA